MIILTILNPTQQIYEELCRHPRSKAIDTIRSRIPKHLGNMISPPDSATHLVAYKMYDIVVTINRYLTSYDYPA